MENKELSPELLAKATDAIYALDYSTKWEAEKMAEAVLLAAGVSGLLAEIHSYKEEIARRVCYEADLLRDIDGKKAVIEASKRAINGQVNDCFKAEAERDEAREALAVLTYQWAEASGVAGMLARQSKSENAERYIACFKQMDEVAQQARRVLARAMK